MADFRYRRIPVARWDIRRMEAWLEEKSAEGLILTAVAACVGIFREEEPRRRACKILPSERFPLKEREAKLHLYERLGWECVVGLGNQFLVFMAAEETPDEITEEGTPEIRKLAGKAGAAFGGGFFGAAVFLGWFFLTRIGQNGVFTGLLGEGAAGFLTLGLLGLAAVGWLGERFFCLARLIGRSRFSDSSRNSGADWRGAAVRRTAIWLLWALLLIGAAAALAVQRGSLCSGNYTPGVSSSAGYPAKETEGPVLPLLSLSVMAGEAGWEYTGRVTEDGWQIDNSYTASWRLLAPENYRVVQSGRRADGNTETLRTEYKRAAFRWLAKGYYEEKLAACREEYGEPLLPSGALWEDGAFFAGRQEQVLLIRSGNRVVCYRYSGESDLSRFASEAALLLE